MTTDTPALTERIARLLCDNNGDDPDDMELYRGDARTIMPLIAAEVQAAKAEAWDEGHAEGRADEMHGGSPNPYREQEARHDDER